MLAVNYNLDTSWIIYGLYTVDNSIIRYIGCTVKTANQRLKGHIYSANNNSNLPVHKWIRKYGIKNIRIRVLEECLQENFDYLYYAEKYWILSFLENKNQLLNCDLGGRGSRGRKASIETKQKMSDSHSGEKNNMYGIHRYGKANPMYGLKGELSPLFGRTGESASAYDTKRTLEQKIIMSLNNQKEKNPMYGKKHTEEAKEKIRYALLKGTHTRWHINRNITKDGCEFCDITRN